MHTPNTRVHMTRLLYLYMMTTVSCLINVTNTTDASTIAPGLTNRVEGMFWEIDFRINCLLLADEIYEFVTTLAD